MRAIIEKARSNTHTHRHHHHHREQWEIEKCNFTHDASRNSYSPSNWILVSYFVVACERLCNPNSNGLHVMPLDRYIFISNHFVHCLCIIIEQTCTTTWDGYSVRGEHMHCCWCSVFMVFSFRKSQMIILTRSISSHSLWEDM